VIDTFWASLCEALVCVSPDAAVGADHYDSVQRAAIFLQAQVLALPIGLRWGAHAGLVVIRAYARLVTLRSFPRLPLSQRITLIRQCANAPIAPAQQLVRALRNLALLGYFEARQSSVATPSVPCSGAVRPEQEIKTAVLIIGSGAGGSVTALELASRGHDVVMVEEGQPSAEDWVDPGSTESVSSHYRRRGMTPILGSVPIAYVEGCCVGGSTELNSGFWHRPPAETLLRWKAQYELDAASPQELCPHWQWAERTLGVDLHDGPLPPSSQVFERGATAMNWTVAEVPRTAAHARDGRPFEPGDPRAGGVSRSVIPQAVAAGARLITGYRVHKLERDRTRVVGAWLQPTDDRAPAIRVRAEHVFVCAGATETPSLLRRSGITGNVGDSRRIHPMLKVAARFAEPIGAADASMPLLQVKEFWPEIVLGGAFFSRSHLAAILSNNWTTTHGRMRDSDHMACYYVGVRGTGRGRVRPALEHGRTSVHYALSDEDMWNLSRGVSRLSSLLLEGGATEVYPAVCGVAPIRSQVDAVRWLDDRLNGRACSLTTVHAFSSCPIGERRDRCAADSFGKLHGWDNVYVNDASMIPDSPGVNPQGTIMSLARRNAQHFCDVYRA